MNIRLTYRLPGGRQHVEYVSPFSEIELREYLSMAFERCLPGSAINIQGNFYTRQNLDVDLKDPTDIERLTTLCVVV